MTRLLFASQLTPTPHHHHHISSLSSSFLYMNKSQANSREAVAMELHSLLAKGSGEDDTGDGPFFDLEFDKAEERRPKLNFNNNDDSDDEVKSTEDEEKGKSGLCVARGDALLLLASDDDDEKIPSSAPVAEADHKPHLPNFLTKFRGLKMHFQKNNKHPNPTAASPKQTHRSSANLKPARVSTDEGAASKILSKYFNKIKPLYARASKRYGDKLRFSGPLKVRPDAEGGDVWDSSAESPAPARPSSKSQRSGSANLQGSLRVVCRRLRKSRSASAAVAAAKLPSPAGASRRDDSLIELQDGIQSAIAHCKRSFNTSERRAPLSRSKSDPGEERTKQVSKGNGDVRHEL